MNKKVTGGFTATAAFLLSSVIFSGTALAAQDTCTVASIQLKNASPGTVGADGSVTAGTPVTIEGKVTASGFADSGCSAGTAGAAVTEGNLKIAGQKDDFGPTACKATGVGSFATLSTQALPNATPPGINVVQHQLDSTGLDEVRGYRTEYTKLSPGGSFKSASSVCVNLDINPDIDPSSPCDGYGDVVVLNVVGGAGKGIVAPGDVGPWSYTFEVLNCTGVNDLAVKVQGGTSGWTVFQSASTVPVEAWTATAKSNGRKGTTSTVTWHTILDDEESKTITVGVDGVIPSGSANGSWLNISGNWSAAYNDGNPLTCSDINPKTGLCSANGADKSEYTPQVYVEVSN